jgi:hypothetical protein
MFLKLEHWPRHWIHSLTWVKLSSFSDGWRAMLPLTCEGKRGSGWPDELVENSPKMPPNPFFVKINAREKVTQNSVYFWNLKDKVNNRPKGENWPHLVTLTRWYFAEFQRSVCRSKFYIRTELCGVARFFLVQHTKTAKKYKNIPNDPWIYPKTIKYTKWPYLGIMYQNVSLQGIPKYIKKLGFLVRKYTIWQP